MIQIKFFLYITEPTISKEVNAMAESFKIMINNIGDRENREELRTIKAAFDRLEGGTAFDIFAESEN